MKSDKKSDDLLREKLNSYSSPVPAGLFDAMDKKREEQQTASIFGWRIKAGISAMVLLLGLGFMYWQVTSDSNISKGETTITNSENQATVKKAIENNQTQTIAQIESETEVAGQEKSTTTASIIENNNSTREERVSLDNTQQRQQEQTKFNNEATSLSTDVVTTVIEKSDEVNQALSTKAEIEKVASSFNTEELENILNKNSTLPMENELVDIEENAEVAEQEIAHQSVLVDPLESKGLLVDDKYYAAMPKIECGWKARKAYLYFDAITSIDMAFRTLSPKQGDGETYAILRNKTEGMQESASIGFRASAVMKGGFAMRTGLIYSTIKEPFSQRIYTEDERYITTTDTEGNILGIDTVLTSQVQNFSYANRHKLLDVPVIIGYEIDRDKYNVSLNGGAYINITSSQEGRFLTPNSEIVDFSTNSSNHYEAFKRNVGVSLYGSFAVNYKITPAFHFIFEPYGRYYLNSFTTENHELDQNYFVAGMQVGLRMKM